MSYLVIYLQDSEGFGPQAFLGFSSAHHNTTVPWRIDHNSNNTLFTEFVKSEWKWHRKWVENKPQSTFIDIVNTAWQNDFWIPV